MQNVGISILENREGVECCEYSEKFNLKRGKEMDKIVPGDEKLYFPDCQLVSAVSDGAI